jgi:hypothetical protein
MRPRVIHRLPGRMRIHIPALKNVNSNFHEIATVLLEGFQLPEYLDDVQVNYITGNILVYFQYDKITEGQVMNWIFDIKSIVEKMFFKFLNMDDEEIKTAHSALYEYLSNASKNGHLIDEEFKIPDEIWN